MASNFNAKKIIDAKIQFKEQEYILRVKKEDF